MVIDEPDAYELDDMDEHDIGIFEPGSHFESTMDWSKFSTVLLMVLLGWVTMFGFTAVLMIPLVGFMGLEAILYDPWALLLLTVAEFGFIFPIYRYIKKEGITLRSVGIKNLGSSVDILLGFGVGLLMLGANLAISYLMSQVIPNVGGDELGFYPPEGQVEQVIWVSLWTFAMFAIVGFSEEIAFRGFLQRRMEMYYKDKGSQNYKHIALILTSFIFAAIHLDIIGLGTRFLLGMFMGYLAQRRKYSIIGPTVAHGVNNSAVVIFALLLGP
ncbi:MAG: type II CAAX endopeptidase family protein [Candidatus Thorarchaeota archaeon]